MATLVTLVVGSSYQFDLKQSLVIALSMIGGLWFGGLLPLWISLVQKRTYRRVGTRREWASALLMGILLVISVGNMLGCNAISCLAAAAPGVTIAYSGGKFGCQQFGCCDWSARFFNERWSLPMLEAIASLCLGLVLIWMSFTNAGERYVLITCALGLGVIRQSALYFRDEPIFYFRSPKIDGLFLLATVPLLAFT